MITATLTVRHKLGLHARPAAMFVQTANKFKSKIQVQNATKTRGPVDAKSILGVLTLGVVQDDEIALSIDGPDAAEALTALTSLI